MILNIQQYIYKQNFLFYYLKILHLNNNREKNFKYLVESDKNKKYGFLPCLKKTIIIKEKFKLQLTTMISTPNKCYFKYWFIFP